MGKSAEARATYADLIALPDHLIGEIVGGVLHMSPRPAPVHSYATSMLDGELHGPFRRGLGGPGGWLILFEPELHLGPDVLVPDLAGWRRDRLPAPPETAAMDLPPDWICEVLSPSTARLDRLKKMRVYAGHRVPHAWLLDPIARTLEAYRRTDDGWLQLGVFDEADSPVRVEPFEALALDLALLFPESPESPEAPEAPSESEG